MNNPGITNSPTSPNSKYSSGLRDNHSRGTVGEFLEKHYSSRAELSVVSAYFTIYAYEAMSAVLDQIGHCRFLFGEPTFVNRLDPDRSEKKAFTLGEQGLQLSNQLQQKRIAKQCADWIASKVDIRTIRQTNLLHGKLYHIANGQVEQAIVGSSKFYR